MRCFIAVDLDASLLPNVQSLQNQIKHLYVSLTKENNLHFTLKFLGETGNTTLDEIKSRLKGTLESFQKFPITISGTGVFPNENYIRVVWIGSNNKEFFDLHHAVNGCLEGVFKKEKPSPHLTIARVRSSSDNDKIRDFVNKHRTTQVGNMLVDRVKLKKSTLTREGPIYEDIDEFELHP